MYQFLLASHNIMRWIVVVLAIYALVRIFMGLFGKREFTESDRKSLSFYAISMDIQLVIGLILYFFLSPITQAAFQDFGAAMSNSGIRQFAVEHILLMLVGVILAHVAVIMARRATTSAAKFSRAAIWLTLSVLAVAVSIPWANRPLFPTLGSVLQFFA